MVRLCTGLTVVVLTLVAAGPLPAAAPSPDAAADNAALRYWVAFSMIAEPTEKQDKAIDELLDKLGPVNDAAAAAIAANSGAIKELRRGATYSRCVWGTRLEDGPGALLPHLSKARQLARLACARAHSNFLQGRPAEAIDDLVATMTLGRHAASDAVLVSVMVGAAVEQRAIGVAAKHLGELQPAQLDDFAARLDRLPRATTMRRAMLAEKEFLLEWFIRGLSDTATNGTAHRFLDEFDDPDIRALRDVPREQVLEGAIALRPVYDKAAAIMDLPPDQIKGADTLLAGLSKPAQTLGKGLLPAAMACRKHEAAAQTRFVMLKAAIAVIRAGSAEALKTPSLKDPNSGEPFSSQEMVDGFRLVSKTLDKQGKPVTLEIGMKQSK